MHYLRQWKKGLKPSWAEAASSDQEKQESRFPKKSLKEIRLHWLHTFRLLTSRTLGEYNCIALSRWTCGDLFQQHKETDTFSLAPPDGADTSKQRRPLCRALPLCAAMGSTEKTCEVKGKRAAWVFLAPSLLWTMISSVVSLCGLGSPSTDLETKARKTPLSPSTPPAWHCLLLSVQPFSCACSKQGILRPFPWCAWISWVCWLTPVILAPGLWIRAIDRSSRSASVI